MNEEVFNKSLELDEEINNYPGDESENEEEVKQESFALKNENSIRS